MTHPLTCPLIVRRSKVGASHPEGRRLTMSSEILKNLETAETPDQRANLQVALARVAGEIEQIQRDGGEYIHTNHGAQR
jgi:hypothetical protein